MTAPAAPERRPFGLTGLVDAVFKEQGIPATPDAWYVAAREIARRIPAALRGEVFIQALALVVKDRANQHHPRLTSVPPVPQDSDQGKKGDRPAAPGSAKVTALRRYGQIMRATYNVVGQKEFGDYTTEDLAVVVAELDGQSRLFATKASRYRNTSVRMTELGIKTVRELPLDVLDAVFGDEAA